MGSGTLLSLNITPYKCLHSVFVDYIICSVHRVLSLRCRKKQKECKIIIFWMSDLWSDKKKKKTWFRALENCDGHFFFTIFWHFYGPMVNFITVTSQNVCCEKQSVIWDSNGISLSETFICAAFHSLVLLWKMRMRALWLPKRGTEEQFGGLVKGHITPRLFSKSTKLVSTMVKIIRRWKEYFQHLINSTDIPT